MKLPSSVVALFEVAINRALQLDPDTNSRIQQLSGKVVGIELRGVGISFYLAPRSDGLQLLPEYGGEVHTWIRGAPFSLLRTSLSDDRSAIYGGDVKIDGDMETGQRIQRLLKNIHIDWEEPLSKVVGDAASHQLGQTARHFFDFLKKTATSLSVDAAEYFKEERRDLVSRYEVDQYCRGVDGLRLDADRLEQRIQRLVDRVSRPDK